jgi:hypothetical protein
MSVYCWFKIYYKKSQLQIGDHWTIIALCFMDISLEFTKKKEQRFQSDRFY